MTSTGASQAALMPRPSRSSAPLIVDRTMKDRDLAGHFSTAIREADWKAHRKSWWTWTGQRRHDLDAIFAARYQSEGTSMPMGEEMEAVARAMAFHLQATEGPEHTLVGLVDWFEDVIPCRLRHQNEEPDLEEIARAVAHRRFDITAIRSGQLLQVTWEERCRLRLRTIRPCDLSPVEFRVAARQRKLEQDRERAERTRRRLRKKVRAAYRWQADSEPWLYLGVSRKTWYRHKRARTLGTLVSACTIKVPMWLVECCRSLDQERDTSSSRIDVVSESADALVSPPFVEGSGIAESELLPPAKAYPTTSSYNAAHQRDIEGRECATAMTHSANDMLCPVRVSSRRRQKDRAA